METTFSDAYMKKFITYFDKSLKPLSILQLKNWFKKIYKREFNEKTFSSQELTPDRTPKAAYLEKMAYDVNRVREVNILKVIGKALSSHKKVFIEYGSSHHIKHKKVLAKMLPKFSCEN